MPEKKPTSSTVKKSAYTDEARQKLLAGASKLAKATEALQERERRIFDLDLPPAASEIETLPKSGAISLAIRCAKRVQETFLVWWPAAPLPWIRAVGRAIFLAEDTLQEGGSQEPFPALLTAAQAAKDAADAGRSQAVNPEGAYAVAFTAYAAASAAHLAGVSDLTMRAIGAEASSAGEAAKVAIDAALQVATRIGPSARSAMVAAINSDFALLREAATDRGLTAQSTALMYITDLLWPQGIPEEWPKIGKVSVAEAPKRDKLDPLPQTLPQPSVPTETPSPSATREEGQRPSRRRTKARPSGAPTVATATPAPSAVEVLDQTAIEDQVAAERERIKSLMRQAADATGLSYAEMGQRMGYEDPNVANTVISRLLSPNADRDPSLSTIIKFTKAVGRSIKEFLP